MIDEAYMLSNDILFDNIDEFFEVSFIVRNNSDFDEIKPRWYSGSVFGSDERWFKHKVTQFDFGQICGSNMLNAL